MAEYVLPVSRLNEYVSSLLSRDVLLKRIGVSGEISGFKRHSSGHLYFSIKDEGAIIRAVMFKGDAASLTIKPYDGMQITAFGTVSLYVKDGQYQLYVKAIKQDGEGELYREFLLLKAKLEAKGLFDVGHKRHIPFLPSAVGIVTSQTGAVIEDIINVTRRRFPMMDLIFCPAAVQGENAHAQIVKAIKRINDDGRADVIILGRGGGSIEDLWPFNSEDVAYAIYNSAIPIVSAVGHETDFTIADFVADVRAPTPSAAAEICTPEYSLVKQKLDKLYSIIAAAPLKTIADKRIKLRSVLESRAFSRPKHELAIASQHLDSLTDTMALNMNHRVAENVEILSNIKKRLEELNPYKVLERGYAIVMSQDGNKVLSIDDLDKEKQAELIMHGGEARITVNSVGRRNNANKETEL